MKPSRPLESIHVAGPWCPWPRDWTRDGTCIWPGPGSMPREWWEAFWETQPSKKRPRPGSFLEGYRSSHGFEGGLS